jgi:hypothetical protein
MEETLTRAGGAVKTHFRTLADPSEVYEQDSASFETRFRCPEGRREIRNGGVSDHKTRRFPEESLVELEAGVRVGDEVPVQHRFENIIPGRWSAGRSDR